MGVLTPHVRMDKGSSDLGGVTVVSVIFIIVVFRNMMGMLECSQEVSMWHDRTKKGTPKLASCNCIETGKITKHEYLNQCNLNIILLTFVRNPAPCS